jgi:hypothetical protein
MTDDEIRQAAKDAGIKSWHVKSIENLKEELEAPKVEATTEKLPEPPVVVEPAELTAPRVLLVKQYKDGGHYREWTEAKDVPARLAQGWIKAAVKE